MSNTPRCIRCGRLKAVRPEGENFRCTGCGTLFSGEPDDSGPFSDDPVRSAIAGEERREPKRRNGHAPR